MYILTIKGKESKGAYSVVDQDNEQVLYMFEEKDDAYRYAEQLEAQGDPEMNVISLKDHVAIAACERSGTRYTIIGKNDLVIPPPKNDRI